MPLALDSSLDPVRAAAKIAASTNVRAVVGPLTPQEGAESAPALAGIPWFAPWAVTAEGFVAPQESDWIEPLARALGEAAQAQGAQRLLIGGMPAGWELIVREGFGPLPTIQYDAGKVYADDLPANVQPANVLPGDALLWLGSPAEGATASAAFARAAAQCTHLARALGSRFCLLRASSGGKRGKRSRVQQRRTFTRFSG